VINVALIIVVMCLIPIYALNPQEQSSTVVLSSGLANTVDPQEQSNTVILNSGLPNVLTSYSVSDTVSALAKRAASLSASSLCSSSHADCVGVISLS